MKVHMATSYFLLREPPSIGVDSADTSTALVGQGSKCGGASKKKKPTAAPIQPLPAPLLNPELLVLSLTLDEFEAYQTQESAFSDDPEDHVPPADAALLAPWIASAASGSAAAALASISPPLPLSLLGGGPNFQRSILQPLWRFFKNALCKEFIRERGEVVIRPATANATAADGSLFHSFGRDDAEPAAAPLASIGGLMVVGSVLGKTTLLRCIAQHIRKPNEQVGVMAHTIWIDCKEASSQKVKRRMHTHARGSMQTRYLSKRAS